MNFESFHNAPKSDREEMAENMKFTNSRKLFNKIVDDFSHSDFTTEDIKDAYNKRVKIASGQSFGQSHLDKLTEDGLLDYNSDEQTYSINHSNEQVAKMLMKDELEEKN